MMESMGVAHQTKWPCVRAPGSSERMNSRCVIACYHLGGPGCPLCSLAPVNSVAQKYSIRPSPREGLRVQRLRIRDEMMAATDGFTSRDDARASTQAVQPHSHVKTLRSARVGWV